MHYQSEREFRSFEEFNTAPHGWDADFSTSSAGSYRIALKQAAMPGLLINSARFSSATLQRASTPPGMRTFALPLELANPYCWRGHRVNPTTFMAFPSDRELFSMMGAGSEVVTISFDQRVFDDHLLGWGIEPERFFEHAATIELSQLRYRALRAELDLISEFAVKYGNHLQHPDLSRGVQEHLVECMLASVTDLLDGKGSGESIATRRVQAAAEYVLEHLCEPVAVADVASYLGCSRRSLEQSFRRYAGTSPRRFIQVMRLHECRRVLSAAGGDRQVKQIAIEHGFWHMGQFAADYRALFGELPSETLSGKARLSRAGPARSPGS